MNLLRVITAVLILCIPSKVAADEVRIAVASNFSHTLKLLANKFEAETGHKVIISTGSSGKHFAQIIHGAKFDVFLSADEKRPFLLEKQQRIIAGSRKTYAYGVLVLWSDSNAFPAHTNDVLPPFNVLAIANPKLAPYGRAAVEVLQYFNRWPATNYKQVMGENVSQSLQFARSGNVDFAFVALAQIKALASQNQTQKGSFWCVPASLYSPIKQQLVQLSDKDVSKEFVDFILSKPSQKMIEQLGYYIDV